MFRGGPPFSEKHEVVWLPVETFKQAHLSSYDGTGAVTKVRQIGVSAGTRTEIWSCANVDYGRHSAPKLETTLLIIRKGEWVGIAKVGDHGQVALAEGTIQEGDLIIGKQYADKYTKSYVTEEKSVGNWTSSSKVSNHSVEPTPTR